MATKKDLSGASFFTAPEPAQPKSTEPTTAQPEVLEMTATEPRSTTKGVKTNFEIQPDTLARLKAAAIYEGTTITDILHRALNGYLEAYEKENGAFPAAILSRLSGKGKKSL